VQESRLSLRFTRILPSSGTLCNVTCQKKEEFVLHSVTGPEIKVVRRGTLVYKTHEITRALR
jgi:hypothetical protein